MKTISVVVSVWNEEQNLSRCLSSVAWANEIIVVDNSSSDGTKTVAGKFTKHIYDRKNNPMLNINKNYGFTKATGEYILNLDGDEEIPVDVASEIRDILDSPAPCDGYWIPRKNIIFGKWIQHGLWWPDRQLRLFRRGKGKFPCVHIHEYIAVDGMIGELKNPFLHHNYETVSQYLRKLTDIYTENEVENLTHAGYVCVWTDALRFPVSDFVKIYFAQQGYKDGLHGLVLAILQAFYSFVVFAKLWERNGFRQEPVSLPLVEKELNRTRKEVRYWTLSSSIRESSSPVGRLLRKIQRKLLS